MKDNFDHDSAFLSRNKLDDTYLYSCMNAFGVFSQSMKKFLKNLLQSRISKKRKPVTFMVGEWRKIVKYNHDGPQSHLCDAFCFCMTSILSTQHHSSVVTNFTSCGYPTLSIVCHCEHNRVILLDQISEIAAILLLIIMGIQILLLYEICRTLGWSKSHNTRFEN